MKITLKYPARVLLDKGIYDLSEKEARRLLAVGIAEKVNEPEPVKEPEKPKKRTRKKKAD